MNNIKLVLLKNYLAFGLMLCLTGDSYAQGIPSRTFEIKSSNHCLLRITGYTGNTLSLSYQSLPANQAGQNHNSLWVWRSSAVPWKYPPMRKQMLPSYATQSGSYVIDSLSISVGVAYIACYAVGPDVKQVCACSVLPAVGDSITNSWVDISVLQVDSNSMTFKYSTLPGYLPADYGNWYGVWKGAASPYNLPAPLATGKPTDNSESSTGAFNGVQFEAGQTYTLIYFAGKDPTTAVAMVTFLVR